ncbi:hypothetical protein KAFR_0C01230 [Kazachstania africana CBS 2517]|uniref:Uncharacterized protein n=1 Tax=Kazachstania africana (strain ATCC 22294 / BCRC 22015 / CBS 2517 / CECT 1963 / NBRC 1671 / NRRL Y-8276) TaxID=1071382 RepID=H2ARW8_KAZAF|nr:hypothetical protein KAFR_0C01230 [Kazachstania africana CBS 2517]CCF57118.1 hypothetical protein KAFR_0C01230 [Kazachstania africana CBS 2517]
MDTVTSINRLRAQFFRACPEKDQMNRIIRPYAPGQNVNGSFDTLDTNIRELFMDADGSNLLRLMESPPTSDTYMDVHLTSDSNLKAKQNRNAMKNRRNSYLINKQGSPLPKELDVHEGNVAEQHQQAPRKSKLVELHNATSANNDLEVKNDNMIHELNRQISLNPESDSDFNEEKKKHMKKSTLPFRRIFRMRRDSNTSVLDTNDKRISNKTALTIPENSVLNIKNGHKYALNFDYDDNLDEDDEEDDDDDNSVDLRSQFFQLNKITNLLDPENNHGTTTEGRTVLNVTNGATNASTLSGNVSKIKSHFPQLPRGSLLDTAKNSSSKSESLSISKNGVLNEDDTSIYTMNESVQIADGDNDLSDIYSYITEQDLDNLNLDIVPSNDEKSYSLKHNSTADISKESHSPNSMNVVPSNTLTEQESEGLSAVSSYGKSLLGSDFSDTDFIKPSESTLDSDVAILDSDMPQNTVGSHSIPMSFEGYGLHKSPDDSALRNIFDKEVLNIRSSKNAQGRDRKSLGTSLRDTALHNSSSKRNSVASAAAIKHSISQRQHARSTSSASNENVKHTGPIDVTAHRNRNRSASNLKPEYSPSPMAPSNYSSRRNSKEGLHIEKNSEFTVHPQAISQLSTLFNKKKQKVTDAADVLEYFSFVSGDKVPKYEAMDLDVYIQSSEKYKKDPFTTSVRKSAKVFEVIGFILFMYTTNYKPVDYELDGMNMDELMNPNNFSLHVVDEDGEPFEDNFGKLNRNSAMQSVSDNEIVLCRAGEAEKTKNQTETPIPYNLNGEMLDTVHTGSYPSTASNIESADNTINQLSFYKPIVGNTDELDNAGNSSNVIEVTVYLYPNVNPKFNFTKINVLVTANVNDILVKYCRMKNMDPNEYCLKLTGKNSVLDLNDTVLRLDGNNKVEIVSKKDARELHLEKIRPDLKKPNLPTIQSNDLTPLTLEADRSYLNVDNDKKPVEGSLGIARSASRSRKTSGKYKLGLSKQVAYSAGVSGGGFFKTKNTSKSSLQTPQQSYHQNTSQHSISGTPENPNGNTFQDLFSGAYHKYKVWRRQQMSLINKHERTLALDGDYVYIVPPEGKMHWHENIKTKSFHINQIILVKKSKRVPEYFKIYVERGPSDIKRYYFEALSAQECTEIVTRIENLLSAYKMNHK